MEEITKMRVEKMKMIEKELRKLLKIDAGAGPGTARTIDRIVKNIMDGKRGLTFDLKQGKLVFFSLPIKRKENIFLTPVFAEALKLKKEIDDTFAPVLKEIEDELGEDVAKSVRKAIHSALFKTSE